LAILYSIGLVGSVHQALLDGPALTLIAIGVLMADLRKPWISAMVLGLAGLGKETSILAASLFGFPKIFDPKQVFLYALKLGIVVLPLALWMYYVARIGHSQVSNSLGSAQNFDWPLFGWWAGVQSLLKAIDAGQSQNYSVTTAIFLIALPVQVFAVLAMRQTSNHWWRVGAVFAVFSIFIGIATWEGLVGSAARLCMPVTVAFNILAPRTGKWFVVLILGNMLSLLGFQELIHARPPKSVRIQSLSHELPGSSYFYSNTLAFEVPGDKRPLSFMLMNPTLRTK
jgi:magnesium-transporting ATPase (P-type)